MLCVVQEVTAEDEADFDRFLNPSLMPARCLADIIMEKIKEKEAGGPAATEEQVEG